MWRFLIGAVMVSLLAGLPSASLGVIGHFGDDSDEYTSLFDGKTLQGWSGHDEFWSVEDGAITGQTTPDNPTDGNTFLIWQKGKFSDFVLKLDFKITGGNSGIQYRSKDFGDFVVGGYQADIDATNRYTGILYEEKGRGILCQRTKKVRIGEDGEKHELGRTAAEEDFQEAIKANEWNEYVIEARGDHLIHRINGVVTAEVIDLQSERSSASGIIALQLHAGPPMKVQFKNIRLKELK